MPMMDMSAALTNPYTLDQCIVCRRKTVNNAFGEANPSSTNYPVYAVITPDGANGLKRGADAQDVVKEITVIGKFAFRTASGPSPASSYQADLIVWRGAAFIVIETKDYSQYGAGFIWARAEAFPLTQIPPETK